MHGCDMLQIASLQTQLANGDIHTTKLKKKLADSGKNPSQLSPNISLLSRHHSDLLNAICCVLSHVMLCYAVRCCLFECGVIGAAADAPVKAVLCC